MHEPPAFTLATCAFCSQNVCSYDPHNKRRSSLGIDWLVSQRRGVFVVREGFSFKYMRNIHAFGRNICTKEEGTKGWGNLPYFPAHKTHLFSRKMWLKFDLRLMRRGYYFQTYIYLYSYYTSLSWDSEICFQIMRSGITACARLTFL
jgi:hypothetical protein